jgi:hypothetical protein
VAWKVRYNDYLIALSLHASSTDDAVALTQVGVGPLNPVNGYESVWVKQPLARALGLISSSPQPGPAVVMRVHSVTSARMGGSGRGRSAEPEYVAPAAPELISPAAALAGGDGSILLNLGIMNFTMPPADPTLYSLYSVACHEIDEILASGSALNGLPNNAPVLPGAVYTQDLFRFATNGSRSYTTDPAAVAWFSLDGVNLLARYNQYYKGDYSDWYSPGGGVVVVPEVQDAFQTPGSAPGMDVEWRMLDAQGFNFGPVGTWVDFSYVGTQTGTFSLPFSTLVAGTNAAAPGTVVFVRGGFNSSERPTLVKPLTITTVRGSTRIGFP